MKRNPGFTPPHFANMTGIQPIKTLGNIKRKHRLRLHRQSGAGFTLLEVLISVTLVVSIFIVVVSAVVNALRENRARQSTLAATDHAQRIVRSVVSLIRQAEPSPTGAYPIVAAADSSLNFYTAASSGSAVQLARLFRNGSSLQLGLIQPVGSPPSYPSGQEVVATVLTGVQNGAQPLFQYFDKNYTGSQVAMNPITLSSIRLVKMTVVFDDNPLAPPGPSTIELQAQLRNLKDNQ